MIIFGGGGSSDNFKAKVAFVDAVPNASSKLLFDGLGQIPVFDLNDDQIVTLEEGKRLVEKNDISALIVLPEKEGASEVQLIVNREHEQGATTQAVSSILDTFIQQANLAVVGANPTYTISMESVTSASEDTEYQDFLFTGMIGLSVAQGGLFGMVNIVDMRKNGLLKRFRMTPARMGLFGLASMLVRFLLGIVQVIILALVGVLFFGANLNLNVLSLVIAFFAGTLVFNAMGYLFSSFSKTIESYMGLANIASMLMMFLSGIFFPVESLPEWLQVVPKILPLTYFVEGMRDGLIYANGVLSSTFWTGMGIMALWGVFCFVLASKIYQTKSIAATR